LRLPTHRTEERLRLPRLSPQLSIIRARRAFEGLDSQGNVFLGAGKLAPKHLGLLHGKLAHQLLIWPIMQKFSIFLVAAAAAVALYSTLSGWVTMDDSSPNSGAPLELDYDGYSEGINTVLYDSNGNINYTLRASRQYHYKDQSSRLDEPYIRLFKDGSSYWNIVAESGHIAGESTDSVAGNINSIDLSGDVEVYSLDEHGNRTVLSTQFLTINPESETMETDLPVDMVTTTIKQSGIGMFANLQRDEIQFFSNNTGRYEPIQSSQN